MLEDSVTPSGIFEKIQNTIPSLFILYIMDMGLNLE